MMIKSSPTRNTSPTRMRGASEHTGPTRKREASRFHQNPSLARRANFARLAGVVLTLSLLTLPTSTLADWPQFRGVNSSGIGTGSPPIDFGPGKNQLWKIKLAPGHSSPCIVGERIFLTTYHEANKTVAVVCLEKSSGKTVWQNDIPVDEFEKGHPSFNPASSTPACDGERVVAYFGSYGLICFDIAGTKLWDVKMPMTKSFGGNATSPVIIGDRVILYRGNYVDHFLLAVNKKTGKQLWKISQDEPIDGEMACTAVPIVAGDKLIVHTARSIQAIDLSNGNQIWFAKCATTATSTPVIAGDEVIVAAWNKMGEPALRPSFPSFEKLVADHDKNGDKRIGPDELPELWIFHRPDGAEAPMNGGKIRFQRVDKNKDQKITAKEWSKQIAGLERFRSGYETHGILAIPIDSKGQIDPDKIRTLETQGIPEVPSPICDGKHIYFVKNGGVLTCLNLKTGKQLYRTRTGGRGTHYASPLIADERIYSFAGDGKISVLTLGENPELLATNDMRDGVYATPAIVDGTIYVRTHSALFAFGKE